jgi:hypothetical protein
MTRLRQKNRTVLEDGIRAPALRTSNDLGPFRNDILWIGVSKA